MIKDTCLDGPFDTTENASHATREFKIGDRVWSDELGLGGVIEILGSEVKYPVCVQFKGAQGLYTKTGAFVIYPGTDAYDIRHMDEDDIPPVEPPVTTEALRYNSGKTPYAFLPLDLLDGASRVMEYGAEKYGDGENFRKGYADLTSPLSSLLRHVSELQRAILTQDKDNGFGHLIDEESKQGHLHHVITSAMLLLHSMRLKGYKL